VWFCVPYYGKEFLWMRIDIFSHILPLRYKDALYKVTSSKTYVKKQIEANPGLFDLDTRFRILDKYDCAQVLTLAAPPLEDVASPAEAVELARIANDEMAELVNKYPDRFISAVATLPMNDMDASLMELDRAINELKFRGVQVFTSINGKPLDSPEFLPLYEKMVSYNLPILIHPLRGSRAPDYPDETISKYQIWSIFGWPYETTAAMTRLVFSGILEKYSTLKVITHHCGAMVPYFEQRITCAYDMVEMRYPGQPKQGLTKSPIEYYRMFYNDTAINGSVPALMCAYEFFGADHLLFGTDMPFDSQLGFRLVRQTIEGIEQMDIPDSCKKMIFEDNARKLFRLPV
jgi:predicted TIM-barrel fold metal-dependent hydrolase